MLLSTFEAPGRPVPNKLDGGCVVRSEEYSMWTVLRTAIQMGGASLLPWKQNKITPRRWHSSVVWEDTWTPIILLLKEFSPAQRMRDARRRLMSKGQLDGYHGENWR